MSSYYGKSQDIRNNPKYSTAGGLGTGTQKVQQVKQKAVSPSGPGIRLLADAEVNETAKVKNWLEGQGESSRLPQPEVTANTVMEKKRYGGPSSVQSGYSTASNSNRNRAIQVPVAQTEKEDYDDSPDLEEIRETLAKKHKLLDDMMELLVKIIHRHGGKIEPGALDD